MNGYTKIRNDFLDWLVGSDLDSGEIRVLLFLIRKIAGWNKKTDAIPITQFIEATKLSKRMVIYSVNKLIKVGLVSVVRRTGKVTKYSLIGVVQPTAPSSAIEHTKLVQPTAPIKRNKETIQKGFQQIIKNGNPVYVEL